jgi:outer membrane receptor protein involved in Fe transport
MLACAWSPAAAEPGGPRAASARGAIDIPATTLPAALALLARQAGVSIGWPAPLPALRTPAVRGRLTAAAALARLLRGTPYRAVAAASGVWRIEPSPPPPRSPTRRPLPSPAAAHLPPPDGPGADIVVTATKRDQRVATIAAALAVADRDTLATIADTPDTGTLARQVTGLSATNLGPGRDRLFIRGVADSPFDGFGQSSVSVQLDDARLTYDAPDPGLRLVDMARVEVLKGPQGPLYGTGALGGVFRLVPEKPALGAPAAWLSLGGSVGRHGAPAGAIDAMIDVPLVTDRLGLRAVGYRSGQAGWIDTADGARGINHGVTSGGRVALRARPGRDWTIDVQGVAQASAIADSQYTERPHALSRTARLPEPQDTDIAIAGFAASGPLGTLTATLAASATWQNLAATYDASTQATALGGVAPATYRDRRAYRVTNYEARVAGSRGAIDWLAGASLLSATTDATGTLATAGGDRPVLRFRREIGEAAAFSEATWRIAPAWAMTGGVRLFRSAVDDRRRENDDQASASQTVVRASPSLSLAWMPRSRLIVFARYASALRAGGAESGLGPGQPASAYRADELSTIDLGLRWSDAAGRIAIDAGLFGSRWSHVQADLIGPTGLISTRNAGDAGNRGAELTVRWRPTSRWTLAGGLLAQSARLEESAVAASGGDRRLPVVPDLAGHIEAGYGFDAGDWRHRAGLRVSYVGETRLGFDPGLDRESEAVPLAALSWTTSRGGWSWQATLDNVTDTRADSFAFGNPFTIAATAQHTPVRPRTLTLAIRRRW